MQLPENLPIPGRWARGPLPDCHWVIPGRFLAGGMPGVVNDEYTTRRLSAVVCDNKMSVFVSLTDERDRERPGFHPYRNRLLELACGEVPIIEHPIPDGGIVRDREAIGIAYTVINLLENGENVYLHCMGGHGRAGTIVCLVIGLLYQLTANEALVYCRNVHAQRDVQRNPANPGYCAHSPQTLDQHNQVRRLLSRTTRMPDSHFFDSNDQFLG